MANSADKRSPVDGGLYQPARQESVSIQTFVGCRLRASRLGNARASKSCSNPNHDGKLLVHVQAGEQLLDGICVGGDFEHTFSDLFHIDSGSRIGIHHHKLLPTVNFANRDTAV